MAARTASGIAAWGVQGSATGVSGIVTDIDDGSEAILAPEYNEAGQVVKQTLYDTKTTVSATVEVAAGTAAPAAGSQITINGKQGYVVSSRITESNQAYRKIAVTIELYASCNRTTSL